MYIRTTYFEMKGPTFTEKWSLKNKYKNTDFGVLPTSFKGGTGNAHQNINSGISYKFYTNI